MADTVKELVEELRKIEGVLGVVVVSKDDGSLVHSGEGVSSEIPEVVAFLGSAGEVIASMLDLGGFESSIIEGDGDKILIVPYGENYLGFEISKDGSPWWLELPEVGSLIVKRKLLELDDVERIFKEKIKLINLLIQEFGGEKDSEEWLGLLKEELPKLDGGGKILKYLNLTGGNVVPVFGAKEDLSTEDVSEIFEKLVNLICKKAIQVFGFVDVKKKFQAVIGKMALYLKK